MSKGSIAELKRLFNYKPRPLVAQLLSRADELLEASSPFIAFLSAPTGYGKSKCTMSLAAYHVQQGSIERLIHVLPLRAIVEDLYCDASKRLRGLDEVTVGAQAMHILDVDRSPYLLPRLVYTTFDSFAHCLFKRPVAEMDRLLSHFDVPRYAIYSSLVVFDEAHLYHSEEGGSRDRMFTAFLASIEALTEARVPVVIMTATLTEGQVRAIMDVAPRHVEAFLIDLDPSLSSGEVVEEEWLNGGLKLRVGDEEFKRQALSTNPSFKGFIAEGRVVELASKLYSQGLSVLVVRNTVGKAKDTARELRARLGYDACQLLHGRMSAGDRRAAVDKLRGLGRHSLVAVTTQVIEAGVDVSFDVLISDAAPASSLIQRVGRVSRRPDSKPGSIYIIEGLGGGVYDEDVVLKTVGWLRNCGSIAWRLPSATESLEGFKTLLEHAEGGRGFKVEGELKSALLDIDRFAEVAEEAGLLQRSLCSFVREEGLISASAWTEGLEDYRDSLIPLKPSFLLREERWKRLLDVDERGMAVLLAKPKGVSIERSKKLSELFERSARRPCTFLRLLEGALKDLRNKGIPVALLLKKNAYWKGEGLIE